MKFSFLLEKSATEAYKILQQALKKDAMSHTQVFQWFGSSNHGEMSVEDLFRSGRLSTSQIDEETKKPYTKSKMIVVSQSIKFQKGEV